MAAFASDNYAGAHPDVLAAVAAANSGSAVAYGADDLTTRLSMRVSEVFGASARTFPVFNGTAANVLGIESVTHPWEGVICASTAHLHVDEGGAPERAGRKLLTIVTPDGKLTPELVRPLLVRFGDEHATQPRVISIAQSTELGTVYSVAETRALADLAHEQGLLLHIDGARIFNAAAALGASLRAITTEAGADLLSLGGTKIGGLGCEAVVLLRDGLGEGIVYLRKQSMQLASKMRFISAQLLALLNEDLGLRNAAHANAMAQRLFEGVRDVAGIRWAGDDPAAAAPQANALFPFLPRDATERLQARFPFYVWDESTGQVRWMTAWDSTLDGVDDFARAVSLELG